MLEKKGTFIFELILEPYIYLRNTQKQLEIINYVRNKNFLEFYLVYNGLYLKLLESLLLNLRHFASLCIKIRGWFCITIFHVLSTFYSVLVYISYTVQMPSSTDYTQKLVAPSVYTIKIHRHFLKQDRLYNVLKLGMTTFSHGMFMSFDSVEVLTDGLTKGNIR